MSRAVAIIPARGGSKRIPGKNVRQFCGKPIISYPIEVAAESGLFSEIQVSTDSPEIADIAIAAGAVVPRSRTAEHAGDQSTLHDLMVYEAERCEFEFLCFILPTAPLLRVESLADGWKMLKDGSHDIVISALRFSHPVQRGFELNADAEPRMLWPDQFRSRSQDLPAVFHDAGQFYWGRTEAFRNLPRNFFDANLQAVVLDPREAVDIDNEEDWQVAEQLFQLQRG